VYFGFIAETAETRVTNIPHSSGSHPGSDVNLFNEIITTHYMPNATELRRIWNEQRKRGHALI